MNRLPWFARAIEEVLNLVFGIRITFQIVHFIDDVFLRLSQKQDAGQLSGGQQPILALARVLITRPKLLLPDEPSLGLAPGLLDDVFDEIVQINKEMDVAILIVEQRVREVLGIYDRVYGIKQGKTVFEGISQDLLSEPQHLKQLFIG